jgi:hypothetical protein
LHGGKFIVVDRTGTYNPAMLILEGADPEQEEPEQYTVHTVELVQMIRASETTLSDNRFHPNIAAWFGGKKSLESIASCVGVAVDHLIGEFVGGSVMARAFAYDAVVATYGKGEMDQYPHEMSRKGAELFCEIMLAQIEESKSWHEGLGLPI